MTTCKFNYLEAESSQGECYSHTVGQTTFQCVSVYVAGFCLCSRLFCVANLFAISEERLGLPLSQVFFSLICVIF
jgi:hypothetical protein